MLYAIGETVRLFYDAYKLATGIAVTAYIRKPDGTKATQPCSELYYGSDPDFQGTYSVGIIVDQDGPWLVRFDANNLAYSRPESIKFEVNTAMKQNILKINSAAEIDAVLSLQHGAGSWGATSQVTIGRPGGLPI